MLNEAPLTPLLVLPRGTFAKDPAKRDCAVKVNNFLVFIFWREENWKPAMLGYQNEQALPAPCFTHQLPPGVKRKTAATWQN